MRLLAVMLVVFSVSFGTISFGHGVDLHIDKIEKHVDGIIDISQCLTDVEVTVENRVGTVFIQLVNSVGQTVYQAETNSRNHTVVTTSYDSGDYTLFVNDNESSTEFSIEINNN